MVVALGIEAVGLAADYAVEFGELPGAETPVLGVAGSAAPPRAAASGTGSVVGVFTGVAVGEEHFGEETGRFTRGFSS